MNHCTFSIYLRKVLYKQYLSNSREKNLLAPIYTQHTCISKSMTSHTYFRKYYKSEPTFISAKFKYYTQHDGKVRYWRTLHNVFKNVI